LQIEHRQKHPDHDNCNQHRPDMPVDERARLAYYQANDRARLARYLRDLALAEDWDAVVSSEEGAAERLQVAARAAYDSRMDERSQSVPAIVTAVAQEALL